MAQAECPGHARVIYCPTLQRAHRLERMFKSFRERGRWLGRNKDGGVTSSLRALRTRAALLAVGEHGAIHSKRPAEPEGVWQESQAQTTAQRPPEPTSRPEARRGKRGGIIVGAEPQAATDQWTRVTKAPPLDPAA